MCVLTFLCPELPAQFKTKEAPIMTKGKDVHIEKPHPEYPRPQMTRNEWMNLNGVWEFQRSADLNEKPPFGKKLTENILVPFPVESALSGIMEQLDKFWYRRTFEIPSKWKGKKILIHFGAVDYEAEVFINGKKIGLHKGGYLPFSFDITDAVTNGKNELIVRVYDPTDKRGATTREIKTVFKKGSCTHRQAEYGKPYGLNRSQKLISKISKSSPI